MKHVRTQIRRAWSGGMLGVLQDAVEVYNSWYWFERGGEGISHTRYNPGNVFFCSSSELENETKK